MQRPGGTILAPRKIVALPCRYSPRRRPAPGADRKLSEGRMARLGQRFAAHARKSRCGKTSVSGVVEVLPGGPFRFLQVPKRVAHCPSMRTTGNLAAWSLTVACASAAVASAGLRPFSTVAVAALAWVLVRASRPRYSCGTGSSVFATCCRIWALSWAKALSSAGPSPGASMPVERLNARIPITLIEVKKSGASVWRRW
jgi:hypothetical protein